MEQEGIVFTIEETQVGQRLDRAISVMNVDWSRVRIQDWIQNGCVRVNGEVKKGSYRTRDADVIEVHVPSVAEYHVVAESIPLDIRFEDKDVLVVNKPRGMVVHPGSGNESGTLVNALLAYCREDLSGIGGVSRPGIVHRIDKDTSGLLMVAKNDYAHRSLAEQLKEHTVERRYIAIVHGVIPHDTGTIDAAVGRDSVRRQQMAVVPNGKNAVTHFSVEQRFDDHTVVCCKLETGRTHQIRVHMKYIGFPIVGDPVYGLRKDAYSIQGQALHAQALGFQHPRTGEKIYLEAELPSDMSMILAKLDEGL